MKTGPLQRRMFGGSTTGGKTAGVTSASWVLTKQVIDPARLKFFDQGCFFQDVDVIVEAEGGGIDEVVIDLDGEPVSSVCQLDPLKPRPAAILTGSADLSRECISPDMP